MKVLYLDTSSKYLSLAVAKDTQVLARTHKILDRKHSLQLVVLIEKTLKRAGLSLRDLDGFCVGIGPGSFTGLRIGITAVKGLAYVLKKPVVAISSLDILAENVALFFRKKKQRPRLQICPLIDAKQNKVYSCLYQLNDAAVKRKSAYRLLPIKEVLSKLKGEIIFLGDALMLYGQEISTAAAITPIFAQQQLWYPQATAAISLAMERFKRSEFENVFDLVPLYLYPKECQIKKRKFVNKP